MTSPAARRPPAWVLDVVLAIAVAVVGVLPSGHEPRWGYPLAFLGGLALAVRRRFPHLALLATFPALVGQLGSIAAAVALYSLGRQRPSYRVLVPWVLATALVTVLPVAFEEAITGQGPVTGDDWVVTVLSVLLITIGPAAAGVVVNTRARLAASLEALRAAEADRDVAIAAKVRAEERSRIAREVHDIVGHTMSLIAVQASALETRTSDAEVKRSAAGVRELCSRALDEMRAAVSDWVDEPDEPAGGWVHWVLQPAVAASQSGVDVHVERPSSMPDAVGEPAVRALRRVVQEGVTNAVKHSPGAPVRVSLATEGAAVRVVIRNVAPDGQHAEHGENGEATKATKAGKAGKATKAGKGTAKGGSGLAGLTDRLGPLGGSVSAGCGDDGQWVLDAKVPAAAR